MDAIKDCQRHRHIDFIYFFATFKKGNIFFPILRCMPYAFTFNIQCNWNWNFCLKNPHFSMLKIYRIILNSHLFLVLRYWSFKYIDMNILYTGTWQIHAHFWLKHTGCWISTGLHTRTHRYTTTHNLGVSSNACIANNPISVSWVGFGESEQKQNLWTICTM